MLETVPASNRCLAVTEVTTSAQSTAKAKRLDAKPIRRIIDRKTGVAVGWVYQWNNGDLSETWHGAASRDVVYE